MSTGTQPANFDKDRPVVFRGGTVLTMDAARAVLRGADVLVVGERSPPSARSSRCPRAPSRSTPPAASSCRG